jgi:hypothetical protein
MRSLSRSPDPALPGPQPLMLILAALAPPIWGVAGVAFGLTLLVRGILVVALLLPLGLVLTPLVLASRSWPGRRWGWLAQPDWFREQWSWLCRCWLRWPWLCWRWLH